MKISLNKYKRWSSKDGTHIQFLREHYLKYDTRTLAHIMGRTVDSVRKELKKLGLKRPCKTKPKGMAPSKRGRKPKEKTIFDMRNEAALHREKQQKHKQYLKALFAKKARERKRVDKDFPEHTIPKAPETVGKACTIRLINGKVTYFYGTNQDKLQSYANQCECSHSIQTKKTKKG